MDTISVPEPLPIVGVGALIFHNNRVLLVRRANPPYANQWAIPGGKIHYGETLQEAAEREIMEETGITIQAGEPVFCFDLIQRNESSEVFLHYVVVDVAATYVSGEPTANDDATAVKWFGKHELSSHSINKTTLELLGQYEDFK